MTTYAFQGHPGADRAVLLAHGAGTDLSAPALTVVADALAAAGIPSLRFNYPYRDEGRGRPDRPPVLFGATRAAVAELGRRTGLAPERMVVGGRSMGGRYCSMVVGAETDPVPALGLVLLGYPLHAAGTPGKIRDEHFPRITVPTLFVSGTRDSLASVDGLTAAAARIPGAVSWCWLETADHGFKPLRASGRSLADDLATAAAATVAFVQGL